MSESILVKDYSEKSFLVYGTTTKKFKDKLKCIGGKYNRKLQGWIFSNRHKNKVDDLLLSLKEEEEEDDNIIIFKKTKNDSSYINNLEKQLLKLKTQNVNLLKKVKETDYFVIKVDKKEQNMLIKESKQFLYLIIFSIIIFIISLLFEKYNTEKINSNLLLN